MWKKIQPFPDDTISTPVNIDSSVSKSRVPHDRINEYNNFTRKNFSKLYMYGMYAGGNLWHPKYLRFFKTYSVFVNFVNWLLFWNQFSAFLSKEILDSSFQMVVVSNLWIFSTTFTNSILLYKNFKNPFWFVDLLEQLSMENSDETNVQMRLKALKKTSRLAGRISFLGTLSNWIFLVLGSNVPIKSVQDAFIIMPVTYFYPSTRIAFQILAMYPCLSWLYPISIVSLSSVAIRFSYKEILNDLKKQNNLDLFWRQYLKLNEKLELLNNSLAFYMLVMSGTYVLLTVWLIYYLIFSVIDSVFLFYVLLFWTMIGLSVLSFM
jgi:hypothetical protein